MEKAGGRRIPATPAGARPPILPLLPKTPGAAPISNLKCEIPETGPERGTSYLLSVAVCSVNGKVCWERTYATGFSGMSSESSESLDLSLSAMVFSKAAKIRRWSRSMSSQVLI